MKKQSIALAPLIWVLLLLLTAGLAAAQSESDEAADDEEARPAPAEEPESGTGVVYTTDYLKKRFSEEQDKAPSVITNESLRQREAEPAPVPTTAFTNEDLAERFGAEEAAEEEGADSGEPPESEAEEEGADPGEPPESEETSSADEETALEPAEPAMSAEERAELVSEIDAELARLEKRLLAIRNPLLAGTAPPTDEEAAEEAGLDSAERLRRTEAKIDELKQALEELRTEPATPPRD
jgi:hypothetical protein